MELNRKADPRYYCFGTAFENILYLHSILPVELGPLLCRIQKSILNMKVLKTFSNPEEAHLLAAFLGSEGIDARISDDHSLGGNLMASINPNAIRIEIHENHFDRAVELLAEYEEELLGDPPTVPFALLPTPSDADRRFMDIFRFLIYFELILYLFTAFYPSIYGPETHPREIQEYLDKMSVSHDGWFFAYAITPFQDAMILASCLLMLTMLKMARIIYLLPLATGMLIQWGPPPYISTPLGSNISALQLILPAIISTMSFTEPLSKYFRKRFTDPPVEASD